MKHSEDSTPCLEPVEKDGYLWFNVDGLLVRVRLEKRPEAPSDGFMNGAKTDYFSYFDIRGGAHNACPEERAWSTWNTTLMDSRRRTKPRRSPDGSEDSYAMQNSNHPRRGRRGYLSGPWWR